MLIVNNEILNLQNPNDKRAIEFKRWQSDFRKNHEESVRYVRNKPVKKNKSGLAEKVTPHTIPMISSATASDGSQETWMYSPIIPPKKEGIFRLDRKGMLIGYDITFTLDRDIELLYYLTQKNNVFKKHFKLDDPAAEARKRVEEERIKADINQALFATNSPLANDSKLMEVAAAWGIGELNRKDVSVVRFELRDRLVQLDLQQKKDPLVKGSKEFLASLGDIDDEIRKRSLIRRAIDAGKLKYEKREFYFIIAETPDRPAERLFYVPPEKTKDFDAFEYFCTQLLSPFNEAIWKKVKKVIIDSDYLNGITRMDDIRWLAKEESISQKQKSLDDLKGELIALYPS